MQRIISLVPSFTEILYFLNLEQRIVGVTEHCNFPEQAKTKAKVGTFGEPELDKILSLKPDLVIADQMLHRKVLNQVQGNGIKVFAATPVTIKDVLEIMGKIGELGNSKAAPDLINGLAKRVRTLYERPVTKRPRVLRLMNTQPCICPGPGSWQYDALKLAGGTLLDFKSDRAYQEVSLWEIINFDPEIILFCGVEKGHRPPPRCKGCVAQKPICQRTADDFLSKEWEQITAVKKKRVFPISCDTICRPGQRLIDGIERLQAIFAG